MPLYQYYTLPVLPAAGTSVVAELPLYGVYMDKTLNGAGNFNGTYKLDTGKYNDANLLAGSIPGFHALVVKRDYVCVWAGIIWSRTYASESSTVQLTGQTFESIFEHIALTSDFVKASIEQVTIFTDMVTALQAQTNCNFSLVMSPTLTATGVTRSLTLPGAENHFAVDVLNYLLDADNGLSYSFNFGSGEAPTRNIRLYNNAIPVSSDLYYEYPGTIAKYWYSENSARGGVRHVAQGPGSYAGAYQAVNNADLIAANWPAWTDLRQYPDISDTAILTAKATEMAAENKVPVPSPTYELNEKSNFTGWDQVGQTIKCRVQDARFPDGLEINSQLTGWSLQPEASDSPEVVRLVLAGDS